jgi:hypothetical protein
LHPTSDVGEIEKAALAHVTVGRDAACQGDGLPFDKGALNLGHGTASFKGSAKRIDSKFTEGLKFLPTDGNEFAKR